MNIDEYLAIKNDEAKGDGVDAQVEQDAVVVTQENQQETPETTIPVQQEPIEQTQVQTGEQTETTPQVSYDEFTKTQQELEQLRQTASQLQTQAQQAQVAQQYYDKIMADPGYAKVFAEKNGLEYIDPQQQAVIQLEQRYNDLLLQREIENMQIKYSDFNAEEVIKLAVDKGLNNLEDAYVLSKATAPSKPNELDVASIKEQIRQEVLNELQSNVDTSTLVGASGGGAKPVTDDTPKLSPAELRVAQNMKMSPQEYAKWRNIK